MLKDLIKDNLSFPIRPNSVPLLFWRLYMVLSVHVTLFLVGYQAAFNASVNIWQYVLIYLGDLAYLINTILYFCTAIKCRGKIIRDRDVIIKRNRDVYFVTDVLSLLPLEIFGLGSSSMLFAMALLRLNRMLRIIRITRFLCEMQANIRINLMISHVVTILSVTLFLLNAFSCTWYSLACENTIRGGTCKNNSWATIEHPHESEGDIEITESSSAVRYMITCYFILQTIFTIGYGDIHPVNNGERIFAIAIMLSTYIAYGLILGRSAAILAGFTFRRQTFKRRFSIIRKYLKRACIKEDLQEKVIKYYEYTWEHSFGNAADDMIGGLPIITRYCIVKNLYEEMFTKVSFLKNASESFLREIALIIQKVVLVPDQVLLNKGQEQSSMCFIDRGVLEVQQGKSKHQLTDGQYFGEISLIYTVHSNVTIVSLTDCELFVIKRDALRKVLYFHPEVADSLRNLMNASTRRLFDQEIFTEPEEIRQSSNIGTFGSTTQSHSIRSSHESPSKHYMVKKIRKWIKQLSDWIIYPNSMFWKVWEKVMLLAVLVIVNWYMIEAAYSSYYTKDAYGHSLIGNLILCFGYCFEVLFVFDILVSMKKANYVHIHHGMTGKQTEIRANYIRSITFYLDVMAILPLEIFAPAFSNPWEFLPVLKLNRLLKLWKFAVIINNMNKYLYNSEEKMLAIKLISLIIITINFFGCTLFAIVCSFHGGTCIEGSWAHLYHGVVDSGNYLTGYTTAIYWAATTVSQTGYGDIHAHLNFEYLLSILIMTIGLLVFNISLISLTAILLNSSYSTKLFREVVSALHKYIHFHIEEKEFIEDVNHHLDMLWNEYRGEGYSAAELFHELPENLRDEVIFDELGGILQNVPFFEGTETGFLKKLIKTVSTNLHCPGDYVYHAGDLGEEMYFVKKGFVEILSEDLSYVVNKLGSGGYFGEFGMLNRVPYNASVRCATYCELLSISRNDLDRLLKFYPSLQKELKQWEAANEIMKDLKANVGESLPKTFATFGAHSALAAAMIVPVSIAIQKPLICNVAGWWSKELWKKVACPISCRIFPAGVYVYYSKESDDPLQTVEVQHQRKASLRQSGEKIEVPFKLKMSSHVMSQASGLFERRKTYIYNEEEFSSGIKMDSSGHLVKKKLDRIFSYFLMPYVIMPKSTFNMYWEVVVTVLCYISAYTLIVQAVFYEYSVPLWTVNYAIDVIMLANVFLGLHTAYYNVEGIMITNPLMCAKHYIKTNLLYELVANMLPTDLFAFLGRDHKLALLALLRLNRLIRIFRVIMVTHYLETWINIPVVLARAIGLLTSLLVLTHWIACFWELLACPHIRNSCLTDGWGSFSNDSHGTSPFIPIENKSNYERYAISFYWAAVTSTQVGYGDIIAYTDIERWFTSIVMIFGAIGYSYSVSTVASCFGNTAYGRLAFQDRLHNMEFYLSEKKAEQSAIDRVMNYYNFLWKKTNGLNPMQLMKGLPLSLRTELLFHVYKETIRKITLFKDVELAFIKLVSRYCKPVFIPKDEFIIKTGDICPLMHFITMGTVDVMSEDGEVVYETLKEGDYFGEMCCLCGTPSLVSFKASRNCDLFTLDKADLDICLHFHKDLSSKIFRVANKRYQALKSNVRASSISINNRKRMSMAIRSFGANLEDIELGMLEDDTMATMDIETNDEKISWFKYPFQFTVSHQSGFINALSVFSILFNIVLSVIIPYETFYNEQHISFRVTIIVSEAFYLVEMYFKFHTTYEDEHGVVVKDLSRIVRRYLKSKSGFVVDLIALIPFEVLSFTIQDEFYQERVYLILQLIHLVRMFRIILILSPEYWKIPRWFYFAGIYGLCFLLIIFIVHWITSIAFFFNYGAYNSWKQAVDNLTSVPHELYLRNTYLIIATMTTTGYGDIPINYLSDALFVSVITIIAKLLYSFIVGYYSSISSTPVVRQVDAKQDFDALQMYMDENDLHGTKQVKVLHYIEYIWERNHGYHSTTLFADLPFSLKREIRLISTISTIGKVSFLSKLDKNFLSHLSLLLKSQYFIPGQFIVHKYDLRQCIYFISNGTVKLYDSDDSDKVEKTLYASDIFCEETLFNSQPVQYSAKCVGYVDIYVLEKTDFEEMLVIYPEAIEAISSVVGKGWGIHYLHCSKARHLDTYQNVTLYEGIL